MKAVFVIFLSALLLILIPGYQATYQAIKCAQFRGCVTKDKENATKSDILIHCAECAAWGCTIDGILYGGSGCVTHNVCSNQHSAINIVCKDDPTCAIRKLIESRSENIDRSTLISGSCNPDPSLPDLFIKHPNLGFESGHFSKNKACAKSCKSGKGRCGTFLLPGDLVPSKTCGHGNYCYCNL